MIENINHRTAAYTPQTYKTFPAALEAFLARECPQLTGELTRRALVEALVALVREFHPETKHLRPGQTPWITVHKDEKQAYRKKITDTRLTTVILDLVPSEDSVALACGKSFRELRKEAVIRLFHQAFEQGGCLTTTEVAVLLRLCQATIGQYIREWEEENNKVVPRRGTIHDMGPSLTHKKEIIRKIFLEGKSVEEVSRETNHAPDSVHRYVATFKKILTCRKKGLSFEETAYLTRRSQNLVSEYNALIEEYAKDNHLLEELISLSAR